MKSGESGFRALFCYQLLTCALYDKRNKFPIGFDPQEAGAYKIAPGTFLEGANLENASLWTANLEKANLQGANLNGAAMQNVDILGADLRGAKNITVEQIKESKNWEQAI